MSRSSERLPRAPGRPENEPLVELVETPVGTARLTVHSPGTSSGRPRPAGTLALGHGAGGGIGAVDLVAAGEGALAAGWRVMLFEQPWRVAGRAVAVAPPRLDRAWLAGLARLSDLGVPPGEPLAVGGRSAGARVACRTAPELRRGRGDRAGVPLAPARAGR